MIHLGATVTVTIWKFANAAAQAGIDLENLMAILESGALIPAVLDLIHTLLEAQTAGESSLWMRIGMLSNSDSHCANYDALTEVRLSSASAHISGQVCVPIIDCTFAIIFAGPSNLCR